MPEAIVAEDEALLRQELVSQLRAAWPELTLAAECDDGASALEAIEAHQPDVAFLDIRMPGLTGLEVAAAAGEVSPRTQVVFVTAYNQHAIEAFERGAVDYLLKPIAPDRLAATIKRVKARMESGDAGAGSRVADELRATMPAQAANPPLQWITASAGRETRLILVEDVVYFQADNKYTVVMTAEGESLIRRPIRELLDVLDPNLFKQIHRSTVVNMRAIAGITRDEAGRGTIRLRNRPETLGVSLTFMPLFRNM
ncbi:MAG TPA: LytTR family DNA-binding domain-containing protein [Usitatibacter sp.]|jgi:DNA-binding LytR/AlgR family response regulator|nr:LytTR family DNA-binding domain-containing protein [Usitatibacter sp.]